MAWPSPFLTDRWWLRSHRAFWTASIALRWPRYRTSPTKTIRTTWMETPKCIEIDCQGSPPLAGRRDAHHNHLIIHLLHSVIYLQLTILCISHSHLIFWDSWLRSDGILSVRLWRQLHKYLCESVKGLGYLSLILVSSECRFTSFISFFHTICIW